MPDVVPQARSHYLGEAGKRYYATHKRDMRGAKWDSFIYKDLIGESDTVLDFGCGSGAMLSLLPGRKKVGLEVNPAAFPSLRALGIPYVSSLKELSGQKFSRIVSSHVLEHLLDPFGTLVQLKEYLDPTGNLVLILPMDDYHSRDQRRFVTDESNQHLYAWTPLLLGNLLTAAGYNVQSITVITHAWPLKSGGKANLLWAIHPRVFHLAAWLTAWVQNRRQLPAIATL
jgi:SAM-dependent methyltransferase